MSDPPHEPFTTLAAAAASIREMFTALLEAGFTEPQALYLTGVLLACGALGEP